jgi:hypothetical protein
MLANAPLFTLPVGSVIPTEDGGTHHFFAAFASHGTLDLITPIDDATFDVLLIPPILRSH